MRKLEASEQAFAFRSSRSIFYILSTRAPQSYFAQTFVVFAQTTNALSFPSRAGGFVDDVLAQIRLVFA